MVILFPLGHYGRLTFTGQVTSSRLQVRSKGGRANGSFLEVINVTVALPYPVPFITLISFENQADTQ